MSDRHDKLGIKQTIRFEWMQKTTNLLLAGLDAKTVRHELHQFLANRTGSGAEGVRSDYTRTFVVNNLMNIWVSPIPELLPFRDASLAQLRADNSVAPAIHWAMISAAYPFWSNVARHTGRLLSLQDQVTQPQIFARVREQFGDRESVARATRFVVRSFVTWNVLVDAGDKGCYEKADPINISDLNVAVLLLESMLLATPDATGVLSSLVNNPACFPYCIPAMSGSLVSQHNNRIDVVRHGLDEELLHLA